MQSVLLNPLTLPDSTASTSYGFHLLLLLNETHVLESISKLFVAQHSCSHLSNGPKWLHRQAHHTTFSLLICVVLICLYDHLKVSRIFLCVFHICISYLFQLILIFYPENGLK